ncbi:MAG: type II toxin-antitoxin system VapC family toxin [Acidobacteriota bacterium]
MRRRVYIETTIPIFYFEPRSEPEMVARRSWTRRWWDEAVAADKYEVVTSVAVIEELSRGGFQARDMCLGLMGRLPLVPVEPAVAEIVRTYIARQVMPLDPVGDALRLALASYHRCDFLVTWNCRHLANANKFSHIRRVNTMFGSICPGAGDASGTAGRRR